MRIGLYSPFIGSTFGGGEKYLGVTAEALREAYPEQQIEIISPVPIDRYRYERMLGLDFNGINFVSLFNSMPNRFSRWGRMLRRMPLLRRYVDLYLSSKMIPLTRTYDLFISMVYVVPAVSRARRGIILCQFPYEMGLQQSHQRGWTRSLYQLYMLLYQFLKHRILGNEKDSFQQVICQSEYVQGWVKKYWNRDSVVVNPPIDIPEQEPDFGAKKPIILSVGRFFATGHCKRQEVMVQVFRQLCDAGLEGWELHLAGSLHRDSLADRNYFEQVCRLAKGYPIYIHTDASRKTVQDLYAQASIYWHAAGYEVDAEQRPMDLEHFGMSTAEAMGYGAVPVAIGRGGQVEVVSNGQDGYLWLETEELAAKTLELINSSQLRTEMGKRARQDSLRFSRQHFKQQMIKAVSPLVDELEKELVS